MAQEYPAIDVTKAPQLDEIVTEVQRSRRPQIIRRADEPVALITPLQIRPGDPAAKERFFQIVERVHAQNTDMDPDEVEADIAAAVAEVRQERYDK